MKYNLLLWAALLFLLPNTLSAQETEEYDDLYFAAADRAKLRKTKKKEIIRSRSGTSGGFDGATSSRVQTPQEYADDVFAYQPSYNYGQQMGFDPRFSQFNNFGSFANPYGWADPMWDPWAAQNLSWRMNFYHGAGFNAWRWGRPWGWNSWNTGWGWGAGFSPWRNNYWGGWGYCPPAYRPWGFTDRPGIVRRNVQRRPRYSRSGTVVNTPNSRARTTGVSTGSNNGRYSNDRRTRGTQRTDPNVNPRGGRNGNSGGVRSQPTRRNNNGGVSPSRNRGGGSNSGVRSSPSRSRSTPSRSGGGSSGGSRGRRGR